MPAPSLKKSPSIVASCKDVTLLITWLESFVAEPVALCDIEGMFHQVGIKDEQQNLLRFFWWEDDDLDKPPLEFRMKVPLFGAVSLPGSANLDLKRTADDFEKTYGNEAA